jgi:hypothetical protein
MADYVLDKGFLWEGHRRVRPFRFVTVGEGRQSVTEVSCAGQGIGVVQEPLDAAKAATGKAAVDVRLLGVSRCVAAEAIARGSYVTTTDDGDVVEACAQQRIVGIALQDAVECGDQIDVLLTPGRMYA